MFDRAEHDPRFDLDGGQWDALRDSEDEGDELVIACNVRKTDHIHVRRVGPAGSGLGARVTILTHGPNGATSAFLASPQARKLAAHLLNAADEIDGTTPLVFSPRASVPEEAQDDPETEEVDFDVDDYLAEHTIEDETPGILRLLAGLVGAFLPRRGEEE